MEPAPCSCPAAVLEATRLEEEEQWRVESMDLNEQEDRISGIYMEQGMQELFWGEDDAQNIPKTYQEAHYQEGAEGQALPAQAEDPQGAARLLLQLCPAEEGRQGHGEPDLPRQRRC